jgi:flagellar basal body L-ring protein FlgH
LRVGDVITVLLSEKTQSTKSAKTDVDKSNDISLPQPDQAPGWREPAGGGFGDGRSHPARPTRRAVRLSW